MWQDTINAIIFDMDGTLVDTERLWTQAERETLAKFDREYDLSIHRAFLGLTAGELITKVRIAYDLEHVSHEQVLSTLNSNVLSLLEKYTSPTHGAIELVQTVCQSKLKVALASNSSKEVIEATLKKQSWADCLTERVSIDDVRRGKPEPDIFLLAAKRLGVRAQSCIVIEDSLNGARAALAANMICLAVPDAHYAAQEEFANITPHVFHSLTEIHHFLSDMGLF